MLHSCQLIPHRHTLPMTSIRAICFMAFLLILALFIFEWTAADVVIQDTMYDFESGQWTTDEDSPAPNWLFYTGPKIALMVFAGVLLVTLVVELRRHHKLTASGRACVYLLLCRGVVPLTVARIKAVSRVHFPDQLERYGGKQPYRKVLQRFPPGCCDPKRPGDCFPAGHASGGFALMGTGFVVRSRRRRVLGVAMGLTIGWAMGAYHMLEGSHFLSHTVVTMLLAFILCQLLARLILRGAPFS